jgi:hypothetical protein
MTEQKKRITRHIWNTKRNEGTAVGVLSVVLPASLNNQLIHVGFLPLNEFYSTLLSVRQVQ